MRNVYIYKMAQFTRVRKLLGEERFQKLQYSSVTVVGIGAVGGYAVEGLARAGVQHLRLVDFDTVQPSNINRQIIALHSTIGQPKVIAARDRVLAINPECQVTPLDLFAGEETTETILSTRPDLLIDAIDSLNPKAQLLTAAYHQHIPIISSMGAALRTDPTMIKAADLMNTRNCPLARRLRKRLRKNNVGKGINCIYSTEPVDFNYEMDNENSQEEAGPFNERGRGRNILGSLPTLTGIFGLTVANLAIKMLTQKEDLTP